MADAEVNFFTCIKWNYLKFSVKRTVKSLSTYCVYFQLTKALKDLQYRVQTASLKERKEVIENVINVLINPGKYSSANLRIKTGVYAAVFLGINENIVKGICRVLVLTLPRYKDSYSQQILRNLIVALLEKHSEVSIKCLISVLLDVATQQKNVVAT